MPWWLSQIVKPWVIVASTTNVLTRIVDFRSLLACDAHESWYEKPLAQNSGTDIRIG